MSYPPGWKAGGLKRDQGNISENDCGVAVSQQSYIPLVVSWAKRKGSMMRALVLDKASWKRHIMLDKLTGMDPPGIKLRAAQGFDAADL